MNSYNLTIISPNGKIYDENIISVVAPGIDGLFGVLARHRQMVVQLAKGIIEIKTEAHQHYFIIDSGVFEVNEEQNVLILADNILPAQSMEDAKEKLPELEHLLT